MRGLENLGDQGAKNTENRGLAPVVPRLFGCSQINSEELPVLYVWLAVLFVLGISYFYFMILAASHYVSRKYGLFFTPFWMFLPKHFDKIGNKYRKRAFLVVALGIAHVIAGKYLL